MISAGGGSPDALKKIQRMVMVRGATSDDYAKVLSLTHLVIITNIIKQLSYMMKL